MQEPIRVLHVFNFFDQGGVENFVMNVYRNIDRDQIQFDFALSKNKKGYFDDEVKSLGGRIFFFDSESKTVWNYYRNLSRIIKENGPYAAIHSHVYYFSGVITLIAKLCGVKTRIAHSHETFKGRKMTTSRKIYEWVMRRLIKWNATICLSCSDIAGRTVFRDVTDYQVLYNGIDIYRFKYNPQKREEIRNKHQLNGNKVLLNVGRFAEQKNHPFIISTFKKLLKIDSSFRLILIGTGPLKPQMMQICKDNKIDDKVLFLSDIKNTEDYYSAADVFLLPSLYEGMPIVVIEAEASGLPVLLADNITREVALADRAQYLSIDHTENDWVKKIIEVSNVKVNRSQYCEYLVDAPYNVDKTVRDLTTIYTGKSGWIK